MLNPQNKLFRWGPISACPLFMYFTIYPSFAPMKKLFGIGYPESIVIFCDNKVTWLLDDQEFYSQSKKFVDQVILNSKNRTSYFNLWNKKTEQLKEIFGKLDSLKLTNLTNSRLTELFSEFSKAYFGWWAVTMTVELVTGSTEPLLGEKLRSYYQDSSINEYNQDFAVLTSPLMLTFYRQEQLDLANVLLLPKNKQANALKQHQKNFYWIYNSYQKAQILGLDYFTEELAKLEKIDYQNILQEIKNYSAYIKRQKQAIFSKIKPDGQLLTLIELVETFSALQDDRKKYNFIADHYLELFVAEFAFRAKKEVDYLKFLLPDELALSLGRINMKLIQERQKCFVMTCQGDNVSNVVGDRGQAMAGVFANIDDVEESVIHGILASTGDSYYFRGTAKIILTIDEISKLLDGEILVTTMTSPDFVIGMKRAGAIITDVGGILSHAAIVSRELGKPCIVGTKIATKVIHDGDVVELHCAKGTVKIIKQSKN